MVVAERRLIVTSPSGDTEVPVRLFQPENDEGMWICRYEIEWPGQKRSHFAGGVDSFQALILALQMIGAELYASAHHKAGSLKWFERYRGYGFPVGCNLRVTSLSAVTGICEFNMPTNMSSVSLSTSSSHSEQHGNHGWVKVQSSVP